MLRIGSHARASWAVWMACLSDRVFYGWGQMALGHLPECASSALMKYSRCFCGVSELTRRDGQWPETRFQLASTRIAQRSIARRVPCTPLRTRTVMNPETIWNQPWEAHFSHLRIRVDSRSRTKPRGTVPCWSMDLRKASMPSAIWLALCKVYAE